jgi:arabinogalactan endo-1,4-beta-galactosidase
MKSQSHNAKYKLVLFVTTILIVSVMMGAVGVTPVSAATNLLTNPGFESDMTGWSTSGSAAADFTQTTNVHTGTKNLAHWLGSAWTVTTFQTVTNLTSGNYTLSAWIKNWGVTTAYIEAYNCGGATQTTNLPVSSTYVQVSIASIPVSTGSCTIGIFTSSSVQSIAADDFDFHVLSGPTNTPTRTNTPGGPTPTRTATPPSGGLTMLGADISSLRRSLDLGQVYYNASGTAQDPLIILKNIGVNYVRLRVWNNPASGYNNEGKVLQDAAAAKAQGLKVMVDFHYSDTWADPGKQFKPAAWSSHTITQLQTDVYNFTLQVCNDLKAQGTTPDSAQIGNEINTGMLWNDGKVVNNDFTNLSLLLKQGYNAIKACNAGTQVIIHTADADSDANARWFYDGITAKGVVWDITGLSYYCFWHGTMANMTSVVSDMKVRYGKPVIIAETAYPFTASNADSEPNTGGTCSGYATTSAGQASNFTAVQNAARSGGAIGVFYWEPTWVAIAGNGWDPANINGTGDQWDNMATFDWTGHVNPNIVWTP